MSETLGSICTDTNKGLVGVGMGSGDVMGGWAKDFTTHRQDVVVTNESERRRDKREFKVDMLPPSKNGRYFIDDVIVSGNTLRAAIDAASYTGRDEIVAGLALNSSRMRKRLGEPVQAAILYDQEGGGIPAMNSLASLVDRPEVLTDYTQRKQINPQLIRAVLSIYGENK